MRVVIDCNVLVSAARSGGVCGKIIVEAIRDHEVVIAKPIVEEYDAIAGRLAVFGLNDPDDEVYLATAVAGGAVLITGNRRDFVKPRYGPVEIISPRAFLERPE